MKKQLTTIPIIILTFFFLSSLLAATELTPAEIGQLERGEIISKKKKITGAPWPELTVFYVIKATPEECAAILSNYPLQKNFTADLLNVEVMEKISPTRKIVAFSTDVPWPAANDMTVTDNQLSLSTIGTYQIKWVMVASKSLKVNRGSARFLPQGEHTLYRYKTFVHPKSALAGLVKKRMIKKILTAVRSFAKYVEQLKARNHPLLKKSIVRMRQALDYERAQSEQATIHPAARQTRLTVLFNPFFGQKIGPLIQFNVGMPLHLRKGHRQSVEQS